MNCEHCGANIDKASNFCPVCGNKAEKKEPILSHGEEKKKSENFFTKLINNKTNNNTENPSDTEAKEVENLKYADKENENQGEKDDDKKDLSEEDSLANDEGNNKEEIKKEKKEPSQDEDNEDRPEDEKPDKDAEELDDSDDNLEDIKDPFDRLNKENRRYINLGNKASPYNQRSVIEEVQAKVSLNQRRKKKDSDYYIENPKDFGINKDLEDKLDKLDKLMGYGDDAFTNATLSYGIRKVQDRNKKIEKRNLRDFSDGPIEDEALINKGVAVREEDKVRKDKESPKKENIKSEAEEEKKSAQKKYLNSRNLLLGLIGVLLAVIMGILYTRMNQADDLTIPLSDYINISFEGDDGQAVPKASIDTDKLVRAYGDDIKYISRDNNKDSYESPAHELANDLQNGVFFQYSKDSGLSNGDEITVMANLDNIKISDKYNVLISNASKAVIIDGIANNDFTDPFTYIDVKFEGESPDITLTASLTDDAPEFMHTIDIIPSKSNGIEAGEEVAVSLNFNEEELMNIYNVKLNPTSKNFTAEKEEGEEDNEEENEGDEGDSDFVKSTANLDSELFGELKYQAGQLINQTILYKNIINVDDVNYLGSFTGFNKDQEADVKNKVYLVYEVATSEKLPDSNFTSQFKYYTFVEYQNVKKAKDEDGKFYSQGPITTDNQIFHKFFVESDYKYYQIEYQGFGFIDKALTNVAAGLEGFDVVEDNKTNIDDHFATSDNVVGEYEADGRRLSLKADGSLTYQIDQAVHTGSYSADGSQISATIKGVNVDTPIILNFDANILSAESQGEFDAISFSKIESF